MKKLRWLLSVSLCSAVDAAAVSIELTGTVLDGSGKPAAFARVIAVDQGGLALKRFPTTVDGRGRYSIASSTTVAALIFVDRSRTRIAEVKGPWIRDARVDLNFRSVRYFTLYGQLVEEKSGVRDLGRELRRGFPSSRSRKIRVKVHAGKIELVTVEPDEKGGFRLRSNTPISHITTHVYGETPARKDGPWKTDGVVNLVHSRGSLFTITGRVLDEWGRPCSRTVVAAEDARGATVARAWTDEDGAFLLRCERTVTVLRSNVGRSTVERSGPWSRHVEVTLQKGTAHPETTRSDETSVSQPIPPVSGFVIHGSVSDDRGRNLRGVRVSAVGLDSRSVATTRTDENGNYRLVASQRVTEVVAERSGYGKGSPRGSRSRRGQWSDAARVDFLFPAQEAFRLTGRVVSRSGTAVPSVRVVAYAEGGRAVGNTWTDKKGRFWFAVKTRIAHVSVRKPSASRTQYGPWAEDAVLDVRVTNSFLKAPGYSSDPSHSRRSGRSRRRY